MTRDDGLQRLFEALPREAAPQIAVESLFRRLWWRRMATAAVALLTLLGGSVAGLILLRKDPEPPVNLRIRLVEPDAPVEAPTEGPAELNLP